MKDKEIIEVFIGCVSHRLECENCPYGNHLDCMSDICNDIIALIKRQQAEIERLKRENKILSINADNAFQDGLNEAQDLYAEQVKNEVRAEALEEIEEDFNEAYSEN